MNNHLKLKEKHEARLKKQIEYLKNVDQDYYLESLVNEEIMYLNPETILQDKENELQNLDIHLESLEQYTKDLIANKERMGILEKENTDEIILYFKGIPFCYSRRDLLQKLRIEQEQIMVYIREIVEYFETGNLKH